VAVLVAGGIYLLRNQLRDGAEPRSPRDSAADLVSYIAAPAERAQLDTLESPLEVEAFLAGFFARRDPTPGTSENEFRLEHERRFRDANERFGGPRRGFRSDRGRALILYGPPASIVSAVMRDVALDTGPSWKAVEFWQYAGPAGGNRPPEILTQPALFESLFGVPLPEVNRRLFVFAQRVEGATYDQVFSTESGEKIDPAVYNYGGAGTR
jgi:GWxTD domain-containing protein